MDSGLLPVEHSSSEARSRPAEVDCQALRKQADSSVHVQRYAKTQRQRQVRQPGQERVHEQPSRSGSPAVVVAGSTIAAKNAVLAELLGPAALSASADPPVAAGPPAADLISVPGESYLVLRHGRQRSCAQAFVPGSTRPQPYAHRQPYPAAQPLSRPPRRVELALPAPLLTHLTLVQAPAEGAFGTAYNLILLDAAARGGALLFTLDATVLPSEAELDFLVGAGQALATVFFAFCATRAARGADLRTRMAAYRDVVASRVSRFEDAPWFLVTHDDAADLRQALIDWSTSTPGPDLTRSRAATSVDGRESGWQELLDRAVTTAKRDLRQSISSYLAELHTRCARGISSPGGCVGMPAALDRELHALSLHCATQVDAAVAGIIRRVLGHVLADPPPADVPRRVADALRAEVDADRPELARVLLVTSTSGAVAVVSGAAATGALSAYPGAAEGSPAANAAASGGTPSSGGILPPLGVGLSASCYHKWRDQRAGADAALDWLGEAVRGTELALLRTLDERLEVVREVLGNLVDDAVDHGLLLV